MTRWISPSLIARVLCGLYALMCLWLALAVFFGAESLAGSIGIVFAGDPGRAEFITIYGGLYFGIGLFVGAGAFRRHWREPALAFVAISSTTTAAARLASVVAISIDAPVTYQLLIAEVVLAALGWAGWYAARREGSEPIRQPGL